VGYNPSLCLLKGVSDMRPRIIASVIFLCGLAFLITSMIATRKAKGEPTSQPKSFLVHYLVSRAGEDGVFRLSEYEERAVSSTGEWKETRRHVDGTVATLAGTSEGLYVIKGESKYLYAERAGSGQGIVPEEVLKNHPDLVSIEELAGLKTYILKSRESGVETGYAPETGRTALKLVLRTSPDSAPVLIKEAVKVEFRDLSEDELKSPDLPVKFDMAEERIRALRNSGRQDTADSMERLMEKIKANNK
jgi:hypothetical protein